MKRLAFFALIELIFDWSENAAIFNLEHGGVSSWFSEKAGGVLNSVRRTAYNLDRVNRSDWRASLSVVPITKMIRKPSKPYENSLHILWLREFMGVSQI